MSDTTREGLEAAAEREQRQTMVSQHLTHVIISEVVPTDGRKTRVWVVTSKYAQILGRISWFSRWRKYAFYPRENTIYEEACMRELADFIVERTKDHKAAAKTARKT